MLDVVLVLRVLTNEALTGEDALRLAMRDLQGRGLQCIRGSALVLDDKAVAQIIPAEVPNA